MRKSKNTLPEYKLQRTNRKTLALVITPHKEVLVRAPYGVSLEHIEEFIRKKIRWIEKQLAFFSKFRYAHLKEKEYVSGESFLYLGRRYRLKVVESNRERVYVYRGFIVVETPNKNSMYVRQVLDNWFLSRAKCVFEERLNIMLKKFNLDKKPTLRIRKMKTRWGSLGSSENINLNLLLIHAPKYAIDYVIAHELTHFFHKHHNKAFYSLLESKYPNWKQVKEKLENLIFNEF